jgi:hypothetical protein
MISNDNVQTTLKQDRCVVSRIVIFGHLSLEKNSEETLEMLKMIKFHMILFEQLISNAPFKTTLNHIFNHGSLSKKGRLSVVNLLT